MSKSAPIRWTVVLKYLFFSAGLICLFVFVPGRLGTHEAGRLIIAKALGMTDVQGVTLGIVSRVIQIIWALMGYFLLILYQTPWGQKRWDKHESGVGNC